MTEHLSDRVTALAALTFSDWLLKGADDSICSSLTAMMQTLSEGPQTVAKAACQAAHVLRESPLLDTCVLRRRRFRDAASKRGGDGTGDAGAAR